MSKKKSNKTPVSKEAVLTSKVVASAIGRQKELLTLEGVQKELDDLKKLVSDHASQITFLQEALARKRNPTSNGKIQIVDKVAGTVYPSKNNAYQTLLKSGELKELVEKGVFGDDPEKNTFGWYALVRAWPDRFEEKKAEEAASK